jgi:hypothetical protein
MILFGQPGLLTFPEGMGQSWNQNLLQSIRQCQALMAINALR